MLARTDANAEFIVVRFLYVSGTGEGWATSLGCFGDNGGETCASVSRESAVSIQLTDRTKGRE